MVLSGQLDATAAYTPGNNHDTYCIGSWVHPRTGPDVWKRNYLFSRI